MPFEFEETPLPDLLIVRPRRFGDARGWFQEAYRADAMRDAGLDYHFVQDNLSCSAIGAVRGLHYQAAPFAQAKLVSVLRGAALDVVLDVRKGSPTYGQHFSIELNEHEPTQLLVPVGFAHGFAALADDTLFHYKVTAHYDKASEGGVRWDDPALGIEWPVEHAVLSEKDQALPDWASFQSPFVFAS